MADDPNAVIVFLQVSDSIKMASALDVPLNFHAKILYVAEFGYGTASPLAKLAVLAFYRRIFPTETVKRGVYAIASLCIGWFIAIVLTNILQCRPISAFWDPKGTYTCIDLILYFAGNSVANCIIDLLTLCLPIQEVMRLHVSQSKRAGLCGVFLLGSL